MRVATNKLLLFSVVLSGLFACQKNPEPLPELPPPAKTVTKVTWSEHDFTTYEYNAAGLVTRHVAQWSNGVGSVNKISNTYTYNAAGQITRWQNESGHSTFVYKNGVLEKSEHFVANGRKLTSMVYHFDNKKLTSLIERNEAPLPDDVIETKVTYAYHPDGNLRRIDFAHRRQLTEPFVVSLTKIFEAYDNKPNPEPDGVLGMIIPGVVMHKNNPLKVNLLLPNNTVESFSRYEYVYNAQGLPHQRKQYLVTNGVEQAPLQSTYHY